MTRISINSWATHRYKHEALMQCCFSDGPPSTTLELHHNNNATAIAQQTLHINPMFDQCWAVDYDVGPTLGKHCVDV